MTTSDRSPFTAAQVREGTIFTLERAYRRAKELDSYGPEYGSEGAAAAFAMASRVAEDHVALPDEDAEAWCRRVRGLLDDKLRALEAELSPGAVEARRPSWGNAVAMIGSMPEGYRPRG